MGKNLRSVTSVLYKRAIKPVLFIKKPDAVHDQMIKSGNFAQRLPLVGGLMYKALAYENPEALSQELFGLNFKNPIGLSAGLDKNAEVVGIMKSVGFGFMTAGTITAEAAPGNAKPWFHRLPQSKSLVVNAGLPNHGVEVINKRIMSYPEKTFDNFLFVASIGKTNSSDTATDEAGLADYLEGIKAVAVNERVRMIEINISCPNTFGGEPFTRPEPLNLLLESVDKLKLTKPLTIKMPIDKNWQDFNELLKVITSHNVQAVTIGNLQKNRQAADLSDELPDTVPGNLSGKPCFTASNELIRQTYQTYGDKLVIIGVGGVFTAEDAYAKIRLGASLIDMVTGVIFNGPAVVGTINEGLVGLLKRDGFSNIREAVGVDTSKK